MPRSGMRARAAVALLATAALAGTGCTRVYFVRTPDYLAAQAYTQQGAPPDLVAVAATDAKTHQSLHLRLSRIELLGPPTRYGVPTPVRAADGVHERRAGLGFTIVGAVQVVLDALLLGADAASKSECSRTPGCHNDGFAFVVYGPTLAINGFAALSIGIPLLVDGFHKRADIRPTAPGFVHVHDTPEREGE